PFAFWQRRIGPRPAVISHKLLIRLRRENANRRSRSVLDLHRDLVVLLKLRQLIIKNDTRCRIHSAVRAGTRKLSIVAIKLAPSVHEIRAIGLVDRERWAIFLVLTEHTQIVEYPKRST